MLIFLSFLWVNAEERAKGAQILKFRIVGKHTQFMIFLLFRCVFFFFELIVVSVSTSEDIELIVGSVSTSEDIVYGFWVNLDCRKLMQEEVLVDLTPGIAVYRLLCKLGLLWLGSFLNSLNMDGWSSSGPFRNIWQLPAFKMDSITKNVIFFQQPKTVALW